MLCVLLQCQRKHDKDHCGSGFNVCRTRIQHCVLAHPEQGRLKKELNSDGKPKEILVAVEEAELTEDRGEFRVGVQKLLRPDSERQVRWVDNLILEQSKAVPIREKEHQKEPVNRAVPIREQNITGLRRAGRLNYFIALISKWWLSRIIFYIICNYLHILKI